MTAPSTDLFWLPSEAWRAVFLTFRLALTVTALLLIVSVPLAKWLAFTKRRWVPLVEVVIGLPIVLPPTVLGFYLLALFAPETAVGRFWIRITGNTLAFSFSGLVVGSLLYSLPYAVQPLTAAFRSIPPAFLEAAESLGGRNWNTFWRVTLPLSKRGLAVAAMLTFAHTIGEFGVVMMLGGNIPDRTRVASIALYDEVQHLNYPTAHRLALLLLLISFLVLLPLAWLQRRRTER